MYNPHAFESLEKNLDLLREKQELSDHFADRLRFVYQDFYSIYHRIYGGNDEKFFLKLLSCLLKKYNERPQRLRDLDASREKNPEWYLSHKMSGMMLYVDRFAGNLEGLKAKLDYFDELPVNLLHLMPLMKSPAEKNDGGYAVSDYLKVDKRLGTNAQLKKLAAELHKRGKLLMLDLVVNHTSDEHEWARKAQKGSGKYQKYYHTFADRTVPDLYEKSLPEIFPDNAPGNFTWDDEMQRWVMTVFNNYQWDLNYGNPEVFIEMISILLEQANWGVDIFRLDAVAFLWKQMGTISQNLEQAHELVQLFKICTQIVSPGVIFLAEAIVPPHEIMRYFGATETWSNECDIAYNATLMASLWDAMATHNNRILTQAVRGVPRKPRGTTWINYIRCHDDIGLGYDDSYIVNSGYTPKPHRTFMINYLTGEFDGSFSHGMPFMAHPLTGDARISGSLASLAGLEQAIKLDSPGFIDLARKRIVLLQAIVLAWEGIPMLYYGDELATLNDYSYADNPDFADDNRWVHRPVIDWQQAEKRNEEGTDEEYVFSRIRKLLTLRNEFAVFNDNQSLEIHDAQNEHIFAFSRHHKNQKFLMVANLSDFPEHMELPFISYLRMDRHRMKDLYEGKNPQYHEGRMVLDPYQFYWFYQEVPNVT